MKNFANLSIIETILRNLTDAGYTTPTPIQERSIPILLQGHDLLGIAQTGTGKTASFSLPILQNLSSNPIKAAPFEPRALILAPTRELATQINASIDRYGKGLNLKSTVIFGGVGQGKQVDSLRRGSDILVATSGRLLDLMNQGFVRLNKIEIFVLDEADRMLDMGFINDIRKIVKKLPDRKQTVFFSATMPQEIASLAASLLKNPKRVEITPPATTVERIAQKVIFCVKPAKFMLLRKIIEGQTRDLVLVFTRTKRTSDRVVEYLRHHSIGCAAIHGNKSQSARELALESFKTGKIRTLVATDIAARGIDVQGISHVINFDLPVDAESYVHRIGRTARAGRDGEAISICDETERDALNRIQRLIGRKLHAETYTGPVEPPFKPKNRPYRDPRARPAQGQKRRVK